MTASDSRSSNADHRLRVAFYQGVFQPNKDGTMTTMTRMVDAMRAARIDHLVFTPLPPKPGEMNVPVVALPKIAFPAYTDYAVALPGRRAMWARLDRYRPHLVQIGTPDLGGLCLLRWALARGIPAVGAYHTHFPTYLRYYRVGLLEPLLWRYFHWFYNRCARTLVPSKAVADELEAHGIERLVPWPRGVDTARFNPAHRRADFRRAAGVRDDGEVLFAYAGRLVSEKNAALVAQAFRLVRKRHANARLVWIGDGPERARLERLTPEAHFPGYLTGEALSTAYASADVLVFCSVTETFGNVVLEGMASGLPAIGVRRGGIGAAIDHGRTGLLAEEADPREVARLMCHMIERPDERRRMAAEALAHAARMSWDAVFQGQFSTWDDVLAEWRGRRASRRAVSHAG